MPATINKRAFIAMLIFTSIFPVYELHNVVRYVIVFILHKSVPDIKPFIFSNAEYPLTWYIYCSGEHAAWVLVGVFAIRVTFWNNYLTAFSKGMLYWFIFDWLMFILFSSPPNLYVFFYSLLPIATIYVVWLRLHRPSEQLQPSEKRVSKSRQQHQHHHA